MLTNRHVSQQLTFYLFSSSSRHTNLLFITVFVLEKHGIVCQDKETVDVLTQHRLKTTKISDSGSKTIVQRLTTTPHSSFYKYFKAFLSDISLFVATVSSDEKLYVQFKIDS